jgi:tetratricopeptide (TPR) repeat protein
MFGFVPPRTRALRALMIVLLLSSVGTVPAHAQSASELAERARQVAAAGEHEEAASLFRSAIEAAPGRRREWLREYADQLAYSGEADAAIPLYREAAADVALAPAERRAIERRLGFALLWSGRRDEAVPLLRRVLAGAPDDAEARDALADALAARGREEAGEAPGTASNLLAEAARVNPAREAALTRERAEDLPCLKPPPCEE